MRGAFLDIFKAFDKVWDQFIIFKLHQNEISGKLSKPKKTSCINTNSLQTADPQFL